MSKLHFRVLYREFLFRLVSREVLARGEEDASRLLGRFAAILIFLSIPFFFLVIGLGESKAAEAAAWGAEHALIATTMLLVGLFTVLSWDSAFPDRRDLFVLLPLPLRPNLIFLAKAAAHGATLSLIVVIFNAAPGLIFPFALAPASASLLDMIFSVAFYRAFAAYWITMLAAGVFLLCSVLAVQGILAQLPRRIFLRISAFVQMAAFCLFLSVYFLQPSLASPAALSAAQSQHLLIFLPSYWFFGLFQELNGSVPITARGPAAMLAARAWIGLVVAIAASVGAFLLSYLRTLRKIVEAPDIVIGSRPFQWLPRFGNSLHTAVAQFSIRTLLRSRQHRVMLAFYLGIGFAIVILFARTPMPQEAAVHAGNAWYRAALRLIASNLAMMCFWIFGVRVVFAIPFDLRANWIFRITQIREASDYFTANRWASYSLALTPVWFASALLFLYLWPWRLAVQHLALLGLVGIILTELCLYGFYKVPFTCSYVPGKSNLHITFCFCVLLGLDVLYLSANCERKALTEGWKYALIISILCLAAAVAWWRTERAHLQEAELKFEEELAPVIRGLSLHRDGVL